jgi:hypothetical protein
MRSPFFILGITIIILLGILCLLHNSSISISEPYTNLGDGEHMRSQTGIINYLESIHKPSLTETIQMAAYDPSVLDNDKIIYPRQKHSLDLLKGDYTIDNIATDIMNEITDEIDWKNVYVDASESPVLAVLSKPTTSIDTLYGKKGILNSNFKEDVCAKYGDDFETLTKKCEELSGENCKLTDCCVLLNGTKCVAGLLSGPIFLTENGKEVDVNYYYYKEKCYGNCESADTYEAACGAYTANSTGISKECMIQTFNNYGCPNPKPDALINDNMVKAYSKTSKQYVDNYIKTAVDVLYDTYTAKSDALCNGS